MKKDVWISIRGVYTSEEDSDVIELFTEGQYYQEDGCYYISYEESEVTGFEGSRTTLTVDDDRKVTLERTGASSTQLIVERGVRHQCHYDVSGCGDMMIGVLGEHIKTELSEHGGRLEFKYSLDINSMLASENEMFIQIKESAHRNDVQ